MKRFFFVGVAMIAILVVMTIFHVLVTMQVWRDHGWGWGTLHALSIPYGMLVYGFYKLALGKLTWLTGIGMLTSVLAMGVIFFKDTILRSTIGAAHASDKVEHALADVDLEELSMPAPIEETIDAWFSGEETFELTQQHIDLLRHMQLTSNDAEGTSVMHSPYYPYGEEQIFASMAKITGLDDPQTLWQLHTDMPLVIQLIQSLPSPGPGDYSVRKIDDEGREQLLTVALSEEHIKLIRASSIEAGEMDPEYEPSWSVDPKRPYGAYSSYTFDMVDALGYHDQLNKNEDGYAVIPDTLDAQLTELHESMLEPWLAYLHHIPLRPGHYTFDPEKGVIHSQ